MVWNWQNADCSFKKCIYCVIYYNFRHTVVSGVVVRERSGTPFQQIFWSRNSAPANIVGHSWNANTEAFRQITSYSLGWPSISLFSGPSCPQTWDLASKISKNFPGWHLRTPLAQAPPLLGPRSQKPFPANQNLPLQPCVFYYNFRHTVVPYCHLCWCMQWDDNSARYSDAARQVPHHRRVSQVCTLRESQRPTSHRTR